MKKGKLSINKIRCLKKTLKIFYRKLGMKNIEAREPPSMAESETYWKSLWLEEAQHNERAEWIRREEERKVNHMDWLPRQITEITSYFSKDHNWKSPRNNRKQNYWLKVSQILTGISQNTSMK